MASYFPLDVFNYCRSGDLENYKLSIDNCINFKIDDIISDGFTCLYVSSLNGHFEILTDLIMRGSNVNKCSSIGCSPLFAAIQKNHLKCAVALLDAGADINARDTRVGSSSMYLSLLLLLLLLLLL